LSAEKLSNSFFVYLGADNAEPSDSSCTACADIRNAGNVVKVYPLTVLTGYDTLRTEDDSELLLVAETAENSLDLILSVSVGSFLAPAGEYFVSMVVMMMLVVVIVTAAGAVRTVVVVVFMFVMIVMFMLVVIVMMLMLVMVMIVTAAGAVRTVIVVMFMFIMVVMMVMLMLIVVIIVVVMMMFSLLEKLLKLVIEGVLLCHGVNKLLTGELIPLGSNNRRGSVQLLHDSNSFADLLFAETAGVAEDNTACIGYLVVEEFTEILVVHLALLCVNNGGEAIEFNVVSIYVLNSADNVAEFAYAGGLDEDAVGSVVLEDLFESLSEIADE